MREYGAISVDYEAPDGARPVAIVTFDRPPVNAMDGATNDALIVVAEELSLQRDLGVVVIHGPRHFAAGDDVKEMAGLERGFALQGRERISEAVAAVANIPVPVVAAVVGFALGGGCELAAAADFRITATDATWGLPEVHLGLIPGGGGTQRIPRLVGVQRAKRLIYLGENITGAVAAEWGLADEAVDAGRVLGRATDLARQLADRAPLAVRAAKRAIDGGLDLDLANGLRLEDALFAGVFPTQDAESGLKSFVENGPRRATFDGM
ncbi:enoyl-CoA hydratase/isomerase family protein [Rhodococcus globerulus]|uniref:Enoyl-CoA hydratase-related protein n=1 Tax=Rhodococcus globerulus TaxID=33008 RepID=A0ABU4C3E7_RHOGO|nr:enoyl-CoA hydratase-related protein [Rhodococcus globerulus]MDV6271025.1 enoyl-CoA hydratase-related protein [Rhodococcus globerulus]